MSFFLFISDFIFIFGFFEPNNPINREQFISDFIESVALMETGLSYIINAEGETQVIERLYKTNYLSSTYYPIDGTLLILHQ